MKSAVSSRFVIWKVSSVTDIKMNKHTPKHSRCVFKKSTIALSKLLETVEQMP